MNKKVIAIGNLLMGDDSIGLHVAMALKDKLEKNHIKVIISEADVNFCLDNIEEKDFIFILDSTNYGINPGTVTLTPLEDIVKEKNIFINQKSCHNLNIIDALKIYNINISGFLIGIEIDWLHFSLELSPALKDSFHEICKKVYETILNYDLD